MKRPIFNQVERYMIRKGTPSGEFLMLRLRMLQLGRAIMEEIKPTK